MNGDNEMNFIESAIGAGVRLAEPFQIDGGIPAKVLGPGEHVDSLETLMLHPTRVRCNVTVTDVESFTEYVERFKVADTRAFANRDKSAITAVIDYHGAAPEWMQHKAILTLARSMEFTQWRSKHKAWMGQIDLAEFLDERIDDIWEPDGAAIVEMVKKLEATKSVKYSSGVNLDNGSVQLTYSETVAGTAGKNAVTIPTKLVIQLPVYEGQEPIKLDVKIRYRLEDETIKFRMSIAKIENVERDAYDAVIQELKAALDIPIHRGGFESLK